MATSSTCSVQHDTSRPKVPSFQSNKWIDTLTWLLEYRYSLTPPPLVVVVVGCHPTDTTLDLYQSFLDSNRRPCVLHFFFLEKKKNGNKVAIRPLTCTPRRLYAGQAEALGSFRPPPESLRSLPVDVSVQRERPRSLSVISHLQPRGSSCIDQISNKKSVLCQTGQSQAEPSE